MVPVKITTMIWGEEGRGGVTKIVSGGDLSGIALSEMQVDFSKRHKASHTLLVIFNITSSEKLNTRSRSTNSSTKPNKGTKTNTNFNVDLRLDYGTLVTSFVRQVR